MGPGLRVVASMLLLLLAACGTEVVGGAPTLTSVMPRDLIAGDATPITISGENLFVEITTDLISPRGVRVRDDFLGDLGGRPLQSLVWRDNNSLAGVAPAGLPLGAHDLHVRTPAGFDLALVDAATVSAPPGQQTGVESFADAGATISSTATSTEVDLPVPVDPAHSVLFFNVSQQSNSPMDGQVSGQIINNGQTLHFERRSTFPTFDIEIRWSVIEHRDFWVQRGMVPRLSTLDSAFLQAVDLGRALVVTSLRIGGYNYNGNDWTRAKLVSPTQLDLWATYDGDNAEVEWQVVELSQSSGAAVQVGDVSLASGATSVRVILPTPAPTAHSFLLFTQQLASTTGVIADEATRGRMISDTELEFDRDGTNAAILITWQVLTWDAMTVAHGSTHFNLGVDALQESLNCPANPAAALSFLPAMMRQGKSPYAGGDDIGVAWFVSELQNNGCVLVLTRGASLDAADAAWNVVWF